MLASSSIPRHLARGALGLLSLVAGLAGTLLLTPVALMLLPVAVVFLRGCPMCWTVGLMQTIVAADRRRGCALPRP
jgi:hypothetical protein